jgi:hypothetical protein
MFYGGLAGAAVSLAAGALAAILLARGRRRLRERFDDEYGVESRKGASR